MTNARRGVCLSERDSYTDSRSTATSQFKACQTVSMRHADGHICMTGVTLTAPPQRVMHKELSLVSVCSSPPSSGTP
jgi:hypothetical protein